MELFQYISNHWSEVRLILLCVIVSVFITICLDEYFEGKVTFNDEEEKW